MFRFAAALVLPVTMLTQVPAGATAKCTDGTYSTATSTKGRCSGHGGVASLVSHKKSSSSRSTATATRTPSAPAATSSRASSTRAPKASAVNTTSRRSTAAPAASVSAPAPAIPTVRAPAGAPAGATAQCKDGTYSTSKVHTGACSHHGGVGQWLQQ